MKNLFALLFMVMLLPLGAVSQQSTSTDQAYASYVAGLAQQTGLQTVPDILIREVEKNNVVTNHPTLPGLLKEFYDGAIYYKADYVKELTKLEKVLFIDTEDYGFMGSVTDDGSIITLNSSLVEYPNLARVIFLRQMGKLYNVPEASTYNHNIMSTHWYIDQDHEDLAKRIRTRPYQRETFFEELARANPIKEQL